MRFTRKPEPAEGDLRTVTEFAVLPLTIGQETRWLERVTCIERWGYTSYGQDGSWGWEPIAFVDAEAAP